MARGERPYESPRGNRSAGASARSGEDPQGSTSRLSGESGQRPSGFRDPRPPDRLTSRKPGRRSTTAAAGRKPGRRYDTRSNRNAASARLKRFRQQTSLAVAMTGLVLLLAGGSDASAEGSSVVSAPTAAAQDTLSRDTLAPDTAAAQSVVAAPVAQPAGSSSRAADEAARSVEEATSTIRTLVRGTYRVLPKLGIAFALLVLAGLISRLSKPLLRYVLASFERAEAISAMVGIGVWLIALGAALSVLAGDARALLGSVGLFGLALSWALQAPIESFTGWLLNSFRGYYTVGDRILVGDVFGDVYKIDFLTTMIWEAGGPGKAVTAAQPTGATITFPNSEVLRSNITNFTRDFPYVWDEVTVGVTNESDLSYAIGVVKGVADRVLGDSMVAPAAEYARLLRLARLEADVASHAQAYVSPTASWVDITVRYLVPVRERRAWSTRMQLAIGAELARPEHAGRIKGSYPVRRVVTDIPPDSARMAAE